MTTDEVLATLIATNPRLCYLITEDLTYRYIPISNTNVTSIGYFIHIHYGSDGAGMTEHKCFSGTNLEFLVSTAKTFILNHVSE